MPMKLMVRVRPGVELTWASFCPRSELIRLDLPTFERPRKANSGGPAAGKCRASAAEVRNLAIGFKDQFNNSPRISADARRSKTNLTRETRRHEASESRWSADTKYRKNGPVLPRGPGGWGLWGYCFRAWTARSACGEG